MKVYTKILLWSFGTLVLSLVAFIGVSIYVSMRNFQHGSFVPRFNALDSLAQCRRKPSATSRSRC